MTAGVAQFAVFVGHILYPTYMDWRLYGGGRSAARWLALPGFYRTG